MVFKSINHAVNAHIKAKSIDYGIKYLFGSICLRRIADNDKIISENVSPYGLASIGNKWGMSSLYGLVLSLLIPWKLLIAYS